MYLMTVSYSNVPVNVNINPSDVSNDFFTSRFFLHDSVSSSSTAGVAGQFIRYVDTITLHVTAQTNSRNKIYPPILELHYIERPTSSLSSNGMGLATITTEVIYSSDLTTFWSTAQALFAIACVVGVAFWTLRIINYNRRATRLPEEAVLTLEYLMRIIAMGLSVTAKVFFVFLGIISFYWFTFFKLQGAVYALLPPPQPEKGPYDTYFPYYVLLTICFFGQVVRIIEIIIRQTSVDIFFIDWEKSRGKININESDGGHKPTWTPVSVWRTILAVNEWNDLQVTRGTSLEMTIIIMLFLLDGLSWKYIANNQPLLSNLSTAGDLNPLLNFWNVAFFWILICMLQKMIRYFIVERYFSEPAESVFIDLCTIAKVSVLILDDKYHGYYLHCRSAYTHADGDMNEIQEQLIQEQEGKTVSMQYLTTHTIVENSLLSKSLFNISIYIS